MTNIYFVRTGVWKLNRSFQTFLAAKKYIQQLKKKFNKLSTKLLLNGREIGY